MDNIKSVQENRNVSSRNWNQINIR